MPETYGKPNEICAGIVRVWRDGDGKVFRMRLICSGDCPGEAECKKRRSENHHGGVREWCGCSDIEPTECHIVIFTSGRGECRKPGQKEILCAGRCVDDPEAVCTPIIIKERKLFPSGEVVDVQCQCL